MSAPDLIDALATIVSRATPEAGLYFAALARVSGVAFFLPGVGERVVPLRVKLAAVFAFALILAPMSPRPDAATSAPLLIVSEAINGLAIGFALRCAIFALQAAGAIIAQHLSLALAFGTEIGFEQDTAFATVLVMGGLAAASAAGIHFYVAAALVESYDLLPVGVLPGADGLGEWSALRAAGAFSAALGLSLPFVALGFAYALALALAAKAMAQLPATFVGAPAIAFAGLALFAASAGVILGEWLDFYRALLDPGS